MRWVFGVRTALTCDDIAIPTVRRNGFGDLVAHPGRRAYGYHYI